MAELNQGTFSGYDTTDDIGVVQGIPPLQITKLYPLLDASVDYSPKSAESLYPDPDVLYNVADQVAGVSWANSGTRVGLDLTYVDEPIQAPHIHFPGTTGNYLSVPDSAALDLAGNTQMEIVVRLAGDWFSEVRRQVIVGKRGGASQSYELAIMGSTVSTVGQLVFRTSGATSEFSAVCVHSVPAIPFETVWLKVEWNGAQVRYYIADDQPTEPVSWIEIGSISSPTKQAVTATITANTEPVYIGGLPAVGSTSYLSGRIYYLAIRDAIGGTDVLEIDVATDCAATVPDVDTSFTASSGQTVTIAKSGTAPNTCRLHNTLDLVLPYPWYEVDLPSDLATNTVGSQLFVWCKFEKTASTITPNTQVPLVSAFNRSDPASLRGWELVWSTGTSRIGFPIGTDSGWAGNVGHYVSFWTSTITNGDLIALADMSRVTSTRYDGSAYANTGLATFGGRSNIAGTWSDGRSPIGGTLRIVPTSMTTLEEVGVKLLDSYLDAYIPIGTRSPNWVDNSVDYGRAGLGIEPIWIEGDGMGVQIPGNPTWLGSEVAQNDWVRALNTGVESSIVWETGSGLPYNVWVDSDNSGATFSEDIVIPDTDNILIWVVVSDILRATVPYRDVIQGVDTDAYIDLGLQWDDPDSGTDFPYFYFEIDGIDGYQWGELYEDPDWRVPNPDQGYTEPILLAIFLDRSGTDTVSGYASGKDDWIASDGTPVNLGAVSIQGGLLEFGSEMLGAVGWAYAMSWGPDLERPTVAQLETLKSDVIERNTL